MGKDLSIGQIIFTKKASVRKLNNLLEGYINNPNPDIQKKAYLISSWLQQFVSYVSFENQFDPTKNISYKRGDIVKVNFGFNIGCELGGPHYAVVLDKHNKHSADTITVIPLISVKPDKRVYERDVFLGNELYNTLYAKFTSSLNKCKSHQEELKRMRTITIDFLDALSQLPDSDDKNEKMIEANVLKEEYQASSEELDREISHCETLLAEIRQMKMGSIARIEQITTVSKMRIWIPQKSTDALYDIRFSENAMKKINSKLKELFVFDE